MKHQLAAFGLTFAVAGFALAGVSAYQQGGTAMPPKPAQAARPPGPIVPVSASSLASEGVAYAGSTVSITAPVRELLGATAFSLCQKDADPRDRDILVLAPRLTGAVQPGAHVTVIGEAVLFDPADIAARMKDAQPALAGDTIARFRGKPAIIATSVINVAMTDLAKRLVPAMTPDEVTLNKTMKEVGTAFPVVRAVDESSAGAALDKAAVLTHAFTDLGPLWRKMGYADAVQWSADALRESQSIEAAIKAKNWDAAKAAASTLQQTCGACHGKHRERLDDGTYRLKEAVQGN